VALTNSGDGVDTNGLDLKRGATHWGRPPGAGVVDMKVGTVGLVSKNCFGLRVVGPDKNGSAVE
jgi:hypothetical protein